jgi:outer membrane lipoprotein-sorting protein
MIKCVILIWLFAFANASYIWAQEETDFERWVEEAEELLASIDNYTTIFYRQVQVNGELKEKETMFLKFKKPFKVYLKWIERPHKGRECLYIDGENKNRLKVHSTGLLSSFALNIDPFGAIAMKSSRHPITDIGVDYITRIIGKEFRRGIESGEIELIYHGEETVYRRKTRKVEGIFPMDCHKGYYAYRAVINLDLQMKIPIQIEVYDWKNKLLEYYGFENLILNAGLNNADFDPKNSEYKF